MKYAFVLVLAAFGWGAAVCQAASKDLGNGFRDHGVATPISSLRGTVATVDGAGRNVVLSWLMDHRGCYELLLVDAATGKSEEFPVPFPLAESDSPFASILSSGNRFYTHFDSHFVEFDPAKRAYTFHRKTTPRMAMGMTEDDEGVIWSVTYPQSGVASFNPKTREFKDYGHVYEQNWAQYQRYVAADDAGWVYFALGMTHSQIVMFDPKTGKATPVLAEDRRKKGTAYLYRDVDGKVYAQDVKGPGGEWYELYKGKARHIGEHDTVRPKPIITDSQALFHRAFPDGAQVTRFDTVERKLATRAKGAKEPAEVTFTYASEGAHGMGVAAAPGGTITGGTAFPMRSFSYDPKTDELLNRTAYGQWNTVARHGERFFVGGYGGGFLLEWDPSRPWVDTVKGDPKGNPLFHTQVSPVIHRPHALLPLSDGKTVVMGGTPQYGYTGGGLLFWDRESRKATVLEHADVIPDQSTMALVELPGGKLLGGTTVSAGTGGEKKATEAELYVMDAASKKVEWHAVVFPGVAQYTDLHPAPGGKVYGLADGRRFFVFDPATRQVVFERDVRDEFGATAYQQGPRLFVDGPDGQVFLLLSKGIARVEAEGYAIRWVAKSPVPVGAGGDWLDGRIYFLSGSHLCSYGPQ